MVEGLNYIDVNLERALSNIRPDVDLYICPSTV